MVQSVHTTDQLKQLFLQGERIVAGDEQLIKAIEKALKALQGPATALEFSIHEQTKQVMVKVLERDTGKLIREVPPEKTLDFVASIWKMAGILVDERR
ncbi:flagellar biosynthesis protein FlaG [Paenibacillus xerothermodurans]|uniref:Flagellar biosynthesis protein FlaG n=2 Tax=Paenibacillus xerothermodurans TaxID=1977292 RepID=A0A2W1NUD6_PAEXE|nr:flagellar biosynthesis protein FlaG [Paenibacillus xerothermodurans]